MRTIAITGTLMALHFCAASCAEVPFDPDTRILDLETTDQTKTAAEGMGADGSVAGVEWEVSNFTWGIGWGSATANLVPWDKELRIRAYGESGSQEVEIALAMVDGDPVTPISMGLLRPSSLLIGLNISGTSTGKLVLIEFDHDLPGLPYSVSTLYSGKGFAWPSSLYVDQDKPTEVIIFDEASHSVFVLKTVSGVLIGIATPALAPTLLSCRYAGVGPSTYRLPGTNEVVDSRSIWCSSISTFNPIYAMNTYLIDVDDDWVVDYVELSD